jgi:hypothetical protein
VLSDEIDSTSRITKNPTPKLEAILNDARKRAARFAAYLVATGVLNDPRRPDAVAGVMLAQKQGVVAARQCDKAFDGCLEETATKLSELQAQNPDKDYTQQLETVSRACMSKDPTCPQTRRCKEPDDLPF